MLLVFFSGLQNTDWWLPVSSAAHFTGVRIAR
jgi:hypothetical protein